MCSNTYVLVPAELLDWSLAQRMTYADAVGVNGAIIREPFLLKHK